MPMGMAVAISGPMPTITGLGRVRRWRERQKLFGSTLDNLVEFPPVEPDAATFRAVIDLDPLAFGHDKADVCTDGTVHVFPFLRWFPAPVGADYR
jgi:hypothetical protein